MDMVGRIPLFGQLIFEIVTVVALAAPARGEVRNVMRLNFDPAVEGGLPSVRLEPLAGDTVTSPTPIVRVVSYLFDGTEQVLAVTDLLTTSTMTIELANRGRDDVLGVRVEKVVEGVPSSLAEWRTYYLPGRRTIDHRGGLSNPEPPDFDAFWSDTKEQLRRIPLNPRIEHVPERDTATGRLYKVTVDSWDNVPIVAWYYVPKEVDIAAGAESQPARRYPVVQNMPGWGAEEPPHDATADGFITLSLNPRAHGPSREYFTTPIGHHLWNIDDPDNYYYRAAYMDCLRGLDFLATRPEVDQSRIAVQGGSQGGAFALAMAALEPRVAAAIAYVPYLSSFADFGLLGTLGSGREFHRAMTDPDSGPRARRSLALIDVSHMARRITCPTLVCVGLQDPVCPPVIGIVAYNNIPDSVRKKLLADPLAVHEVTPVMHDAAREWVRDQLK